MHKGTAAGNQNTGGAGANHLAALAHCLDQEFDALLAQDEARIAAALVRKEQLLAQLGALVPPQGLMAAAGSTGRARPAPGPALHRALQRLHDMNRRNALVLAPRSQINRARLQFLQSALGNPTLYGADGSVAPTVPRRGAGSTT